MEKTLSKYHEDRIAGNGFNSLSRSDLVLMLRDDIVKDESGSFAVFTEKGSSAAKMTAAKVTDVTARHLDCAGQAVSADTQVRSKITPSPTARVSRYMDTSSTTQVAKVMVKH